MNRQNFFFDQVVSDKDLSLLQDNIERSDKNLAMALLGPGALTGLEILPNNPLDLKVRYTHGIAFDEYGQRIEAPSDGVVDCAPYAVTVSGQERWLTVVIRFARNAYDERKDGDGIPLLYKNDEFFQMGIVPGEVKAANAAVKPAIATGDVILADVKLAYGQLTIGAAQIDLSRRMQCFTDDDRLGLRLIDDTLAPTGNSGLLNILLGNIGYMLKKITGKTNWRTEPAANLEAVYTHFNAAAPHSGHAPMAHVGAGGTAHAAATVTAAGFMAATDKANLDTAFAHTSAAAPHTGHALTGHTHTAATATTAGFMAATDKANLDTAFAHTSAVAPHTGHAPIAHVGAGGTAHVAATATTAGFMAATDKTNLDSAFAHISAAAPHTGHAPIAHVGAGGTAHAAATTSTAGFMSAADKTKLDGLGNVPLASTAPASIDIGDAAAVGVGTTCARADHQHASPGLATQSADGFMSADDKKALDQLSDAFMIAGDTVLLDAPTERSVASGNYTTVKRFRVSHGGFYRIYCESHPSSSSGSVIGYFRTLVNGSGVDSWQNSSSGGAGVYTGRQVDVYVLPGSIIEIQASVSAPSNYQTTSASIRNASVKIGGFTTTDPYGDSVVTN